jgi:hypothetical protein
VVPRHCHFLSNWGFPKHATEWSGASDEQAAAVLDQRQSAPGFYKLAAQKPSDIGALHHHALNRGNLSSWLKEKDVTLNESLWNRFLDKPVGRDRSFTTVACDGSGNYRSRLGVSRTASLKAPMSTLSLFGLIVVTGMLITYALEKRSHWYTLAFAFSCALGSAYGFLQGAWPLGLVEAVWALVAIRRWACERTKKR